MANSPTHTANGPMLLAAIEDRYPEGEGLTRDPLAYGLLPLGHRVMALACRSRFLRDRFIAALERRHPGGWGGIACRKRYFDEQASAACEAGLAALVNLGAGLDTRAYRLPALARVPVFEVDLPENLARKRAWIARRVGAVDHVALVPVDFDRDDLAAALRSRGLDPAAKTLYLWEGVTQYLSEAGVRRTLAAIAWAPIGSRLCFTYVLKDFLRGDDAHGLAELQRSRIVRELWRFALDPSEVAGLLGEYGLRVIEDIGRPELLERYVRPTGRALEVMEIERFVLAERV
ncbi:MAG: SAM-dependent methyltransferase [Nannocystaceae bacterium]